MCETTHIIKLQSVPRLPAAVSQNIFFKAETGRALTTVLAFIAFTTTVCPNISFFPALVAVLQAGLDQAQSRHSELTMLLHLVGTQAGNRVKGAQAFLLLEAGLRRQRIGDSTLTQCLVACRSLHCLHRHHDLRLPPKIRKWRGQLQPPM